MNDALRVASNEREESDVSIMKKCSEELAGLNELIEDERKARETSEIATHEMIKDVVAKIKNEVTFEKKER